MRSVGIDIGSSSIKVAEITYSNRSYSLREYFEVPFPEDPAADLYVHTLEILRRIAAHYDPDSTHFVVAIPQEHILVRHLFFPFRQRNKIENSIDFELDEDIPFSVENSVIVPKIMSYKGSGSNVLALVTPSHFIDKILELCHDAGLDPDIISCDGAALHNLFEAWKEAPPEEFNMESDVDDDEIAEVEEESNKLELNDQPAQLLLHFGHSKTLFLLRQGSKLLQLQSLFFGGKVMIQVLIDKYSLSYPEAVKVLKEKSFILTSHKGANQDQITFSNTIAAAFDEFASQVKRLLMGIEADYPFSINEIQISGGLSNIQNLNAYLTQCFSIPCNNLQHFARHPHVKFSTDTKTEVISAVAIGLALETLRPPKNPAVNFRSKEYGKQSQFWEKLQEKWGYAMKMGATLLLLFFIFSFTKSSISSGLEDAARTKLKAQAKKMGLRGRAATTSKLKKYVRDKRKEVKTRVQLSKLNDLNSAMDILAELTQALPGKQQITLDIRKFKINENVLELEGTVKSSQQLQILQTALQNYSSNKNVESTGSKRSLPGSIPFAYRLQVSRGIGGQ